MGRPKPPMPSDFAGKPKSTYPEDVRWAYENAGLGTIKPKDAPSPAAFRLWKDARVDFKPLRDAMAALSKREEDAASEQAIQKQAEATDAELKELIESIRSAA